MPKRKRSKSKNIPKKCTKGLNPEDVRRCHCTPECNALIGKRQRQRHYAKARKDGRGDASRNSTTPSPAPDSFQPSVSPPISSTRAPSQNSNPDTNSEYETQSAVVSDVTTLPSDYSESESDHDHLIIEEGAAEHFTNFARADDADVCGLMACIEGELELELNEELYARSKFVILHWTHH